MKKIITSLMVLALAVIVGCGKEGTDTIDTGNGSTNTFTDITLTAKPDSVQPINDLQKQAKVGDEVVFTCVVGGESKVHITGLAATKVIDAAYPNPCLAEDDHCKTPWDYCCSPVEERKANMALIQIVDENGKAQKMDISQTDTFKNLSAMTIKGTVSKAHSDESILTIDVKGIFPEAPIVKK
ncbi:MAG: hypothetical protein JEZ07_09400 [Phycisphaerae bacterium]|nr:hypothetical protein [Phycisphaerae bacterium]